jgi:hypothetical protein
MANPDYAALLAQIAAETDPVLRQALIDQAYSFQEELTNEEIELFEYTQFGYIDPNPGVFQDTSAFYFTPGYVDVDYVITAATSYVDIYYVANNYFEDAFGTEPEYAAFVGNYFDDTGANTGGPYDPSDYISQF